MLRFYVIFLSSVLYIRGENSFYFRKIPNLHWCKELHWQRPPSKQIVALATMQGSGSTWLRYLLQQATGIVTGSTTMDFTLLTHGFPGENVTDGSVLVVKTQMLPNETKHWCSAAILLLRNPADTILAEFNRRNAGIQKTAPYSAYKKGSHDTPSHDWKNFMAHQLAKWEALNSAWLRDFKGPMLLVRYEHLVKDTRATLLQMLNFLGQVITEEEMTCVLANREGLYRRYHKPTKFDPITPAMRRAIKKAQNKVMALVQKYKKTHNETTVARKIEKVRDDLPTTVEFNGKVYRVFDGWKSVMIS